MNHDVTRALELMAGTATFGMFSESRNGTAELLQIIADVADDHIPPVARFWASF